MNATKTAPKLWLNVSEVAALLGVGVRTLWRLTAAGEVPQPHRLSRKLVRWDRRALLEHVRRLQRENAARPPREVKPAARPAQFGPQTTARIVNAVMDGKDVEEVAADLGCSSKDVRRCLDKVR